ncbi:hypothetical protein [Candidatus Providencia siddallii]|uniref:hypothetical protein n=1 Tax=Candidatus Providencia siddallii TaxID=1715285 RepID=UPI00312C7A57
MKKLNILNDWPWIHWSNIQPYSIAIKTESKNYTWLSLKKKLIKLELIYRVKV